MAWLRLVISALVLLKCSSADEQLYDITDEQYYEMPKLFHLDEYQGCLATGGEYCLGSFELIGGEEHQLYRFMKRFTSNRVDIFNHTRLHRGLCLRTSCRETRHEADADAHENSLQAWFQSCVNGSTTSKYNLSAELYKLEYCRHGPLNQERSLSTEERVFAGFVTGLIALAAVSTVLDLTLPAHAKKGLSWALAWSIPGCWSNLQAPQPSSSESDLRAFDGLRVMCMLCVIVEHVCWITTLSYITDTRSYEVLKRASDGILLTNSTLVVQIFFLMSSFLLAHKLLQQRRNSQHVSAFSTFFQTMFNRIIRISPSYFLVIWFAAVWWPTLGDGPMWTPLVETEAAICRRKWWTQLLYLNNIVYADDKCLIQTWYLAADMQLYAVGLMLTLALWRWRRGAIYLLSGLLFGSIALLFGLAYAWRLVPTVAMHSPELVRQTYSGESSFNVLYQSPLGNAPGALAGLLLAHCHRELLDSGFPLQRYKWFRWLSVASTPLAFWWAALSPRLVGISAPPPRGMAAALAAVERPVFAFFVAMALLGAMHDIQSPWRRFLSWRGWSVPARLSFGALLLHIPLNKMLVAASKTTVQIDRPTVIFSWFSIAAISYMAAFPLAMLVEIPCQRLHRAFTDFTRESKKINQSEDSVPSQRKSDM